MAQFPLCVLAGEGDGICPMDDVRAWHLVAADQFEVKQFPGAVSYTHLYTPWSSFGIPEKNRVLAERIQDKFDPNGVLKRMYL